VLFDSSEEQHRLGGHIKRVYNLICHGQNVTLMAINLKKMLNNK
jgi:hypothetical protein